jgi:hypothetical protein
MPAHEQFRQLAARKLSHVDALIDRAQRVRAWLSTATSRGRETLDVCGLFTEPTAPQSPRSGCAPIGEYACSEEGSYVDPFRIGGLFCVLGLAFTACGGGAGPATLPASGRAYRVLDHAARTAVAERCRDTAAAAARGLAARELRAIDPAMLRDQLDGAYLVIAALGRPVSAVCREEIPFVTPGLRISIDGAKDNRDGTFTLQTSSEKRLTISGRIAPAPAAGRVIANREVGPPVRRSAGVGPDGRFVLPPVGLRKVADNTFTVTVNAPPHAERKLLFSAICLDCLAGGPPPSQD